ncbi:MAG TPA: DUF1735 and LamG domain-containing protein [Bacteroides reticulotermitis]|nr:DUF1735 and LamG domain-containing protein [Bacteroides reticulotermitis]
MIMKINKYILGLLILIGVLNFQSCDSESYDVEGNPNNLIYFTSSKITMPANSLIFNVDWTSIGALGDEVVVKLPVKSTRSAEKTIKVHAEVDNSLVALYNTTNGTSYEAFPADAYKIVKSIATLETGTNQSVDSIEVRVPAENFITLNKREYLLPVRLTSVDGSGKVSVQNNTAWATVKVKYPGDVKSDVSITGGTYMGTSKVSIANLPSSYSFTASAASRVQQDETVTFEVDRSLVEYYNTNRGGSYVVLPTNADVTVEGLNTTIPVGEQKSSEVKVTLNSLTNLTEGTTYMLPITMKEVSIGLQPKANYNTVYLIVDYPKATVPTDPGDYTPDDPSGKFAALDISNSQSYSNYYFAEAKQTVLTNFTYEIKINAKELSGISRFFSFNGSNTVMFRFGEGGVANRLQYCTGAGGNHFATTTFEPGRWYMLSLTYNGSKLTMYVDGVKDSEQTVSSYSTVFKGVEIGMSWAGYPSSQVFKGSISEARVWNRVLNEYELVDGICRVDPKSQGLVAYWKLNEGSGYIFHDATGNGYTIDWSDTWRCVTESEADPGTHLTDRQNYIGWDKSESNICK